MDIKGFLTSLETAIETGTSLIEACPKDAFQRLLKTKPFREGVSTLAALKDDQEIKRMVGFSKNAIEIYSDEKWQISLVRQGLYEKDDFAVSASNPILGYCVEGTGVSELTIYDIEGNLEALSTAETWTLKEAEKITIKPGVFFECADMTRVLDFTALSRSHIFLRIVYRNTSPFLFAFSKATKKFSYITFSDEVATSQYFFADLIQQMSANPDCVQHWTPGQVKDLVAFSDSNLGDEKIPVKTRWRLIQSLGMVAPEDAIRWLKVFAENPDPGVSHLARATLDQIEGAGGNQ